MNLGLEDVTESLRLRVGHLRQALERAEIALAFLSTSADGITDSSTSSEVAKPVVPQAKKAKAVKPAEEKTSTGRRFSDEVKADAVDRAAELGSFTDAAREFGTSGTSIKTWKTQGFGGGVHVTAPCRVRGSRRMWRRTSVDD